MCSLASCSSEPSGSSPRRASRQSGTSSSFKGLTPFHRPAEEERNTRKHPESSRGMAGSASGVD
eukprot:7904242-Pyramimonas_sp.AAC.1